VTAYAGVADIKAHGAITDTSRDAEIARLALAASRLLDHLIGVPDGAFAAPSAPEDRVVRLLVPAPSLILPEPLLRLDGVFYRAGPSDPEQDETGNVFPAIDGAGPYHVLLRATSAGRQMFQAGIWRVRGAWGVAFSPPPDIAQAVAILTLSWLRRGVSGYAAETVDAMAGTVRAQQDIPPEVMEVVNAYRARLGVVP